MPNPLLSICIPTNNQAKWLVISLQLLTKQIAELGDKVELNILDDDSSDDTFEVVQKYRQSTPINYQRHINRQGPQASMIELIKRISQGEFIWILSPTVLARPGAVKKIIEALEEHPDIDFAFVNSTNQPSTDCPSLFDLLFDRDLFNFHYSWFPLVGSQTFDHPIDRWERLLEPELTELFITESECCLSRRARLLNFQTPKPGKPYASLFDTYPLAVILAHTMTGCQAYYLGYPCTVSFIGHQDWVKLQPVLKTVRKQELLDELQKAGVDPALVNRARIDLLKNSVEQLGEIIVNPHTPGRKYFDLQAFTARFAGQSGVVDRILDQVNGGLYWREIRQNPVVGLTKMSDFLKNIPYRDWLFNELIGGWKPNALSERASWMDMLWKQMTWASIKDSLLSEWLKPAQNIAIFNPFNSGFLQQIVKKYKSKRFFFIEMMPSNLEKLENQFSGISNVRCLADQPTEYPLHSIDFAWSLFYSQYLPRTLWLHHLKNTCQILRPGGQYLLSIIEVPDRNADDSIQNSISGLECYSMGDITNCAKLVGFKEVELLDIEKIKQGNQQITLRLCLVKK